MNMMREIGIDIFGRKSKRLSVEMQLHADWTVTTGSGAYHLRLAKLLGELIEEFGDR